MAIVLDIANPSQTQILDRNGQATGVTVQDLINTLCNVMDGVQNHDLVNMTGLPSDEADRIGEVRDSVQELWRDSNGKFVL